MAIPRKIPTLLALFILFFTIGAVSFLIQKMTPGMTKASPSLEPTELLITNVSDTSAKIIWQTSVPTTGMITLSTKNGTKISAYDERDMTGKLSKYTMHSVAVKNLQSNTAYTIAVISNGKQFPVKDKPAYMLQTGPTITDTTEAGFEPSYGTIKTRDGKPAIGGIVVVTLEDSQPISSLITPSGSWIVPLNFIRTKDLSRYVPAKSQTTETITVYYGTEKTEGITDTENDAPVPDMTIGTSSDFRNKESKQKSILGDQTRVTPTTAQTTKIGGVSITAPVQNASIVSNRPLIQGTGVAGKAVTLTLGITKPSTGKTTVGGNGLWSFTPKTPLTSGKQSVTITTVNDKGKPVALTTAFTILKAGTQVLGDATPSATITIEATATATPTTIEAEPMPEPGGSLPTILLILMGVGMVAGGAVLLL